MNAFELIRYSFATGVRQWRPALIAYGIQAALALVLGMQIFEVMNASIGQSLEAAKLLKDYDHTVWSDFLKVHGASITPLLGQLRWMLPTWLLCSVFINGGLLAMVSGKANGKSTTQFWLGGARYFFPFLKISLFFWTLFLLWTILVIGPTLMAIEPSLAYFQSERGMLAMAFGMLFLYGIGVFWLFLWSLAARTEKMSGDKSLTLSIRSGWKLLRRHKWPYAAILLSFTGIQVFAVLVYWSLKHWMGNETLALILLFLLIQQATVFIRIQCRQMLYAGAMAISGRGV